MVFNFLLKIILMNGKIRRVLESYFSNSIYN